jgi:hypothetical protein
MLSKDIDYGEVINFYPFHFHASGKIARFSIREVVSLKQRVPTRRRQSRFAFFYPAMRKRESLRFGLET